MYYELGSYTYDTDSQLFFKGTPGDAEQLKKSLGSFVPDSVKTAERLLSLDPKNAVYTTKFATRAGICLTYNCNLRCTYCSDSSKDGLGESVSVEDVDIFIGEVMKRWTVRKLLDGGKSTDPLIVFITGGGEPTYDLEKLVKVVQTIRGKADKYQIPVDISITTNGVCGGEAREFLARNADRVMVSYDGLPTIQNRNRLTASHTGTNEIVEDTICHLLSNAMNSLTIRTTLWYEDIPLLKDMADYIYSRFKGKFIWSVYPVNPLGRALDHLDVNADYGEYDFASAYVALQQYVKDKYGDVEVESSFFATTKTVYYCGGMSCSLTTPWLVPGGTVLACMQSGGRVPIANLKEGRFVMKDIHVDPLLEMAQKKLVECKDCLIFGFCQGGCPAQHIANERNGISARPWSCAMFVRYGRIMFEKVLSGEVFDGWGVEPVDVPGVKPGSILRLKRKE